MSDSTLLVTVEDLINICMGSSEKNTVHFKMLQKILHILARNMRVLEQKVEIPVADVMPFESKVGKEKQPRHHSSESDNEMAERKRNQIKETRTDAKKKDESDYSHKNKYDNQEEKNNDTMFSENVSSREHKLDIDEKPGIPDSRDSAEMEEKNREVEQKNREIERTDDRGREINEKVGKQKERKGERIEYVKETDKEGSAEIASEIHRGDSLIDKNLTETEDFRNEPIMKIKEGLEVHDDEFDDEVQSKIQKRQEKASNRVEGTEESISERRGVSEKIDISSLGEKSIEEELHRKEEYIKGQETNKNVSVSRKEEKEKTRDKDITSARVEKGPTTRGADHRDRDSIQVVTQSQFAILENAVKELNEKAKPLPPLTLPDNEKLREDLVKGNASLTDTMQAMQVNARIQAAEDVITHMTDLLTQLALAGALPQDVAGMVSDVTKEMRSMTTDNYQVASEKTGISGKSIAIGASEITSKRGLPQPTTLQGDKIQPSLAPSSGISVAITETGDKGAMKHGQISAIPGMSRSSHIHSKATSVVLPGVTKTELERALEDLRDDIMKNVQNISTKACSSLDSAFAVAKVVDEKMKVVSNLDERVSALNALANGYAEQLNGFEAGLSIQLQGFQEQMAHMREELKAGLNFLENVNSNSESVAMTELKERFEGLFVDFDTTVTAHSTLVTCQKKLSDDLRTLMETVELLGEEKADRDELQDGLRDKADNSRLAGLLTESEFADARAELESRLSLCHEKFEKQEQTWLRALKDLSEVANSKADIMKLLALRDETQKILMEIDEKLKCLATILGEPKAAMLTRHISRDATCGVCMMPAHIEPVDNLSGSPAALPPLFPHNMPRPPPQGAEESCMAEWAPKSSPDVKSHTCHRWAGGSHTTFKVAATRSLPPAQVVLHQSPTRRYIAAGTDGKLYKLEDERLPCVECNVLKPSEEVNPVPLLDTGAGDQVATAPPITLHK